MKQSLNFTLIEKRVICDSKWKDMMVNEGEGSLSYKKEKLDEKDTCETQKGRKAVVQKG